MPEMFRYLVWYKIEEDGDGISHSDYYWAASASDAIAQSEKDHPAGKNFWASVQYSSGDVGA